MVVVLVDQSVQNADVPAAVHEQLLNPVLESVAVAVYMRLRAQHRTDGRRGSSTELALPREFTFL